MEKIFSYDGTVRGAHNIPEPKEENEAEGEDKMERLEFHPVHFFMKAQRVRVWVCGRCVGVWSVYECVECVEVCRCGCVEVWVCGGVGEVLFPFSSFPSRSSVPAS